MAISILLKLVRYTKKLVYILLNFFKYILIQYRYPNSNYTYTLNIYQTRNKGYFFVSVASEDLAVDISSVEVVPFFACPNFITSVD